MRIASSYAVSKALQKLSGSLSPQENFGFTSGLIFGRVGTVMVDWIVRWVCFHWKSYHRMELLVLQWWCGFVMRKEEVGGNCS